MAARISKTALQDQTASQGVSIERTMTLTTQLFVVTLKADTELLWRYSLGIFACFSIGAAARLLMVQTGLPEMLAALVLGFAFQSVSKDGAFSPGVDFTSKKILRIGVALLGMRITLDQVLAVGLDSIAWVGFAVMLTITLGWSLARWLGIGRDFGVLSGGAVAICGASAALAISAVLPRDERAESRAIVVIMTVTMLSTVAMVAYPFLATFFGLNDAAAGMFLGGSIHDVAQVVGAGYSLSPEVGDIATITKLSRVAMLAPVVVVLTYLYRGQGDQKASVPLPMFVVFFGLFVAMSSIGIIPNNVRLISTDMSGWCLTSAIAALGMKTSFKKLGRVGFAPIGLIVTETLFIGLWILLGAWILR